MTSGEVVTMRAASGASVLASWSISLPKAFWVEIGLLRAAASATGPRPARRVRRGPRRRTARRRGRLAAAAAERRAPRTGPIRGRRARPSRPEARHLRRRHQAGMVVLVAGQRRAVALDRIGDERRSAGRRRPRVEGLAIRSRGNGRRGCPSARAVRRRERRSSSAGDRALVADRRPSAASRQAAPPW